MLRAIILCAAAAMLSGCATLTLSSVTQKVCKDREVATLLLITAEDLAKAELDPVKREARLSTIRMSLALLEKCPPHAAG